MKILHIVLRFLLFRHYCITCSIDVFSLDMYIYDDYANKTITKDTNVIDMNHRYNTQPIFTGGKHLLEKKLQRKEQELSTSKAQPWMRKRKRFAENLHYQLYGEF